LIWAVSSGSFDLVPTIWIVESDREPFDLRQLSRSIEQERAERGLTWKEVSAEVGVATSTIRRFANASDAEADGVLALIRWLDVPPEHFVAGSKVAGVRLPSVDSGVIRVDLSRVADLPTWPRQARAGSRTTIQRLTRAAQASEVPVASLTRWSQT